MNEQTMHVLKTFDHFTKFSDGCIHVTTNGGRGTSVKVIDKFGNCTIDWQERGMVSERLKTLRKDRGIFI